MFASKTIQFNPSKHSTHSKELLEIIINDEIRIRNFKEKEDKKVQLFSLNNDKI